MLAALLICMIPPPSAETLAEYAVAAPVIPDSAVCHELANGETLAIVAEKPRYETRQVAQRVPLCSMGCCWGTRTQNQRICVNDPTPLPALESILRLTGVTHDDTLFDLGCGDGRVCVLASKLLGCFSVGLDIRPEAISIANENARLNGVDDLAAFYAFPIEGQRLQHATVVYVYLRPEDIAKLRIPTNVRMGISYKHTWPGVKCERIGEFYVWRRPEPVTRTASRPAIRLCGS